MLGLIAPTLIALAAGIGIGGSVRSLLSRRIYAWPAIISAFALELLLYNPPLDAQPWAMQIGPWIWVASRLVLLGALIGNAIQPHSHPLGLPWWIAATGLALNTIVIVANGGHMPQSAEAAAAVWGASHIDPNRLQNVALLGPDTRLAWLADVFAEPRWLPRPNVISVGDVLLALGLASWVFMGSRAGSSRVKIR